jgi:transcriptional regulator with XRE-family HTH domain
MPRQGIKNYLASVQNFSNRLAQAITASGKPKGALAAHAGVALSTVSRWMAGTVPKAETLDLIASFLGVDAKWLLTGHEAADPVTPTPPPHPSASSSAASAPLRLSSSSHDEELLAVLLRIAAALERLARKSEE